MRTQRKFLAWLMALILSVSMIPTAVLAEEPEDENGEAAAVCAGYEADETCAAETHVEGCPLYSAPEEPAEATPADKAGESAPADIDPKEKISGSCGATENDNVTWALTQNNDDSENPTYTLTISGSGAMTDYSSRENIPWYTYKENITIVSLEKGVTRLGNLALIDLSKATSVSLPDTLEDIGNYSIYELDSLTSIAIPDSVQSIGVECFYDCDKLETVTFGENSQLRTISEKAFKYCDALESIAIPDSVESIGTRAFWGCTDLKNVDLPNNTAFTTLAVGLFSECTSLQTIDIPSNVTHYSQQCFEKSGLTKIVIPDGVTYENQAFASCQNLKTVILGEKATFGGASSGASNQAAFYNCTNVEVYVYKKATLNTGAESYGGYYGILAAGTAMHTVVLANKDFNLDASSVTGKIFSKLIETSVVYLVGNCEISNQKYDSSKTALAYTNGGTFATDTQFTSGTLEIPTKEGYTFGGWYSDSNFSGAAVTSVTAGQTYYAKWMLNAPDSVSVTADQTTIAKNTGSAMLTAAVSPELAEDSGIRYEYQWYQNGTEESNKIANATEATFEATGLTETTTYYCAVNAASGEEKSTAVTSSAVTIHVAEHESSITIGTEEDGNGFASAVYGDGTATFHYTCTEGITPTVSSSNTEVATAAIDTSARTVTLTILKAGQTDITVSFAGDSSYTPASDTVTFTVGKAYPDLSILANEKSELSLSGGGTVTLTLGGVPEGSQVVVKYTDEGGNVKTVAPENGVYSVSLDNKTASYTFSVETRETDNYQAHSAACTVEVTRKSSGSSSGGSSTSAVSVDSTRHGTVSVSPKSASKGTTVTITVNPDKGYELDDLTVTDKNGNAVKLTKKSDTKYTFTMPNGKVTVEGTFVKVEETLDHSFTDVPDGYWAEDAIAWAYENGYMNGNTAITFNPEGTVSRQQLWMILARLSGYNPATMAEAKSWAVDNGISDGTVPGGAVSRQQLVTILYRYAARMGYKTSGTAGLTAYPDHANVAAYAKDAMSWSVANGIVGGTTQGTLNPAGTATRAQFAVILSRFCENIVG